MVLDLRVPGGPKEKVFALGTAWKRCDLAVTLPAGRYQECTLFVRLEADRNDKKAGTVWIDALQFEKGTLPTEFAP